MTGDEKLLVALEQAKERVFECLDDCIDVDVTMELTINDTTFKIGFCAEVYEAFHTLVTKAIADRDPIVIEEDIDENIRTTAE